MFSKQKFVHQITWEYIKSIDGPSICCRAQVPGGWLVATGLNGGGLTFMPDPDHAWELELVNEKEKK
jgi:hypothetical protein